ncbi:MAG: RHS repeat-associated core domain-containing protein [Candidatus Aenigmatarchaeota archaeon]
MSEKTNIGTRVYGYDDIYQLTSATYERNQAFSWVYDPAGNRLSSVETWAQSPSRSYVPNNLNQYSSVNGVNYTYDADGNLLSNGIRNFVWDIRNRLIEVVNGSKTVSYKYDHNDLRISKEVVGTIHELSRYYYDGSLLLAEKDESGKIQKVYINDGEGILSMVRYVYNNNGTFSHHQRMYYLYDSLGSVSVVTGEDGKPLQEYYYTPYGSTSNVEYDTVNALRFVGRYGGYRDDDSGLVYFWHRWYSAEDGRWVSRDRIKDRFIFDNRPCNKAKRNVTDQNIINLYHYTFNNPLKYKDYTGFDCVDDFKTCVNLALSNLALHEAIIWTAYGLCLGTCTVICAESGPGYPVCYMGCAALCLEAAEASSTASLAASIVEQSICRVEFEKCKKEKECGRK